MHSLAAASAASAASASGARSCTSFPSAPCSNVGQVVWRAAPQPSTTACRRRRQHQPVQAFGSGMEAVQLASGLISTGLIAAITWTMFSQPEAQVEDQDACPRCHGSGYEPCVCTKWSNNTDVGCGGCNQSGYMKCRSCGGRGKAIPLLRTVKAEESSRSSY